VVVQRPRNAKSVTFTSFRGERAKRASLLEDEHTRDESREMTTDIYSMATPTTELNPLNSFGSLGSLVFH